MIKRRLLATLRSKKSNNWVEEVKKVVKNINNTISSKTGFKPEDIAEPESDDRVRKAMIKKGNYVEENLDDVKERISKYEKSKRKNRIYVGDIVQINGEVRKFTKKEIIKEVSENFRFLLTCRYLQKLSFFAQKTVYYKVVKVKSEKKPEMYFIKRLGDKDSQRQLFYASQLVKSKITPKSNVQIQDVLKRKNTANGKGISYVKFRGIRRPTWVTDESLSNVN